MDRRSEQEFEARYETAMDWLRPAYWRAWKKQGGRGSIRPGVVERTARSVASHDAFTVAGVAEARREIVEHWVKRFPELALLGLAPPMICVTRDEIDDRWLASRKRKAARA